MLPNVVLLSGKDANSVGIWETDGTAAGTFELLTNPPAVAGQPQITGEAIFGFVPQPGMSLDLTVFNGQVLFFGRYSPNPAAPVDKGPYTLWTTDGTAAGTVPIPLTSIAGANSNGLFTAADLTTDVTPGFTVFGDEVLFRGIDTAGADGLWVTRGTAGSTTEITAGTASGGINPTDITVFSGAALFNGADTAGHLGLWTTDGTAGGTKELIPTGTVAAATGLNPTDMTVFGGQVLFNGADASGLSGLWATDGTAGGTHEVLAEAAGASSGLDPADMTVFGNEVLFSGVDANGLSGLWVTDGTAGGTHELLAEATGPTATDPRGPDFTVFNGEVFFHGLDQSGRGQLWVTNGTAAGTQMLTVPGAAAGIDPSDFEVYNGKLLFEGFDHSGREELWVTNGTGAGTEEILPSAVTFLTGLNPVDLTALPAGAAAAPTIAGTSAGQTTTSEAPVKPFTHVTIGDANAGATDILTITLGGAGGTLSGTGLSPGVGAGVYTLSGTAGAISGELDALTFTPTAGAPGTASTTKFTLSDLSSANGAPTVNGTTTVIDSDTGSPPTITSDIFWQNTDGQASIWDMDGSTLVGGGPVSPNPGPSWTEIGTGDFNKDGHADILWQNASTGQASIWEMNGNSLIDGGPVTPNPGPTWKAVGTGDFTDDGFSDDILWQNTSSGQASIWEMSGNKLNGGGPVSPNPGPAWKAIGTGDFNHDGFSDVLFQNTSTGQVSIWEMHGNALIGGGPVSPNPGPAWRAVGTGDFNHDGFSDILFQNASSGQVSIWEMHGNTLMGGGPVSPNPGLSWHAIGTDGGSDILLQNTSGQASIWEMSGNTLVGGGPVSSNPGTSWRAVGLT
jgi:ELWxxDGT repeat protein